MNLKSNLITTLFLVLLGFSSGAFAGNSSSIPHPAARNERFVIAALRQIVGAQATHQATAGNGNFGSLAQLGQENIIDNVLASGEKYGYFFTLTTQNRTTTVPASFQVVVVPRQYRKTGIRSFYVDTSGVIRGADKQGAPANQNDPPIVESYACSSVSECEAGAIASLRTLLNAQATYQATVGNGNYGGFQGLLQAGLIDQILASGIKYEYNFQITIINSEPNTPARFYVVAVPQTYQQTGVRSFYIDQTGIIRGADKQGAAANQNDPPIPEMYTCGSIEECEANAITSLQTLHGAEATYQASSGNGNFGSLCQLGQVGLVDQILAGGEKFGYYFVVSHREGGNNVPATFEVIAIPRRYDQTGKRSFYVATDGVVRGADKNGAPANENDPPIQD